MAADTIVMFERGPAFNTKTDFKGTVLARYPARALPARERLLSGPDRIEGKIAALSADLRQGPRDPAGLQAAVARPIARRL